MNYCCFHEGRMPRELRGYAPEHVRINRKHRIVATEVADDDEGQICLWNDQATHMYTGEDKMQLCGYCGLETEFDTIVAAQLDPHILHFGKITSTGIRFTRQDTQSWINPEISAQWTESENDYWDELINPVRSIQILNDSILLTCYKQGTVAVHDIRTPTGSRPARQFTVARPQGIHASLMGAYAIHEGTRATLVNGIQDATRIVVGCGGSAEDEVHPQLLVCDLRMVHSMPVTSPGATTSSGRVDIVESVRLADGMRTMDVSGAMVMVAGPDATEPDEEILDKGVCPEYDDDPLGYWKWHDPEPLIKRRSCMVDLWYASRSLSRGPVAENRTPNECTESRHSAPARLSDDGETVYVPQRDGSVFLWQLQEGEGGKLVLDAGMSVNLCGLSPRLHFVGADDELELQRGGFYIDAFDDILVLGGYSRLMIAQELGDDEDGGDGGDGGDGDGDNDDV